MNTVAPSPNADRPADSPSDLLVAEAVELVGQWLERSDELETKRDQARAEQLGGVIEDVDFAMRFVDRVIRPEDNRVAAHQLRSLVDDMTNEPGTMPTFLSPVDRFLLRAGGRLAPLLPGVVMPLAIQRMRQIVGPLVVDADPAKMGAHLRARREEGFRLNVNQLGEAVLGDSEAQRRFEKADALLDDPNVDYVSVKTSSIVSQLNYWAWDESIERVVDRLRPLFVKAAARGTFINLDMEEYHDLELTIEAFCRLLDEPELRGVDAGIVLQAYLPDSFPALQHLVNWANTRRDTVAAADPGVDPAAGIAPTGTIKIRLVKGANLAMEKVEAATHGWPQAPYQTKAEVDANYKRCLDWVLTTERTEAVRIGLASHNLFDVAWGYLLAKDRGVAEQLELEMLQGMAMPQARAARESAGDLLLYTPVVAASEFDVAISYLFRRLEENASDVNFIRHLFDDFRGPGPGGRAASAAFKSEAAKFRTAVASRNGVAFGPNRDQNRRSETTAAPTDNNYDRNPPVFINEPNTDPALPANREWANATINQTFDPVHSPLTTDTVEVDRVVAVVGAGATKWADRPAAERQAILHTVADELSRHRGDLINAMIHEGNKTFAQADPEVSEAIDFARYYANQIPRLAARQQVRFEPLGVVAVVPPWNFPVAIPAGGVLAALAAGNGVVFKPAPQTPRCAEIVAECCWAAGVPDDALQFIRVPDNEVGQHLITSVDAVILTGAYETAELFRSWNPAMPIFAETSGKNALIITPNADLDLAVADLAASAFGHSGQKCSAASLGILVGDVYESARFRRQLIDAVTSLSVGPSTDVTTDMAPTIEQPSGKLLRGLTVLDEGESWLVEPQRLANGTWTPGVRIGVRPGSWFHQTECFGPVLGLMRAEDLDEAIVVQNGVDFGLTGGIHSLDPHEVETWTEQVEVGNAYINRGITGAIVQRQPFGGWKRSTIGPGAKAGGPNYLAQLGRWLPEHPNEASPTSEADLLQIALDSDNYWWSTEFGVEHDPTGLFCEANVFRYRPLTKVAVRIGSGASAWQVERVLAAANRCGVPVEVSDAADESAAELAARLPGLGVSRVRVLGTTGDPIAEPLRLAADAAGIHLAVGPVTTNGRVELLHYLREQAVSQTLHRYGNLL